MTGAGSHAVPVGVAVAVVVAFLLDDGGRGRYEHPPAPGQLSADDASATAVAADVAPESATDAAPEPETAEAAAEIAQASAETAAVPVVDAEVDADDLLPEAPPPSPTDGS